MHLLTDMAEHTGEHSLPPTLVLHAEPLLERWPFSVAYHHSAGRLQLMISSEACLSLVATASAFRSLGDARRFLQDLGAPVAAVSGPPARTAPGKAPVTASKPTSMCSNYRSVSQPACVSVLLLGSTQAPDCMRFMSGSRYSIRHVRFMTQFGILGQWCMHT